jgi:cytochrome P450
LSLLNTLLANYDVLVCQTKSENSLLFCFLLQVNNFLEETLRLYGPGPLIFCLVSKKNIKLRGKPVPKDLLICVNMFAIHRDKDYWGDDVMEFKPERFSEGV